TIQLARESACASQVLQQRVESMRIANWHQVTDTNWLKTNLLNIEAPGASQLTNMSETLTLVPYGSTTVGNTQLTRTNGAVAIVSCNSALLGFTSLQINYAATSDFSVNHADEMRISDYMAMDLRRSIAVQAAKNDTTIYIPAYYDQTGSPQTPALDGQGGVFYGASGSSVKIHYYLMAGTIYRQQDHGSALTLAVI